MNLKPTRMIRLIGLALLVPSALLSLPGCAPLTKGLAAVNGGGTAGSTCGFSGLFRGSDCDDATANVYLSDQQRAKPSVCGSLTTWGPFGSKNWQPGKECMDDLPAYCASTTLLPGFDNATLEEKGGTLSAQYSKHLLCSSTMKGSVGLWLSKLPSSDRVVVWSGLSFVDAYGKRTIYSEPGEELEKFCPSSVLAPGASEEKLKEYGAYEQAVKAKANICKPKLTKPKAAG